MVLNITLIVIAYLLGSIPSAVWIGRRFYGIDVREHGSHNAGATNTLRVLGLRAALPVFGIDMLKGFVAVMLSHLTAYENGSDAMFANYGKFERQGSESSDGRRYPSNVLFVQTVAHTMHPTQKPVELCEYFIKTYTRPGEVVADICAGSGTTAVAALNTGRRFICFENAPSIYGPAAQRIEQARLAVAGGGKGE